MRWVRPSIISALAATVIVGFVTGAIGSDVFVPFATGLIVYWLKSRDDDKKGGV